MPELRVMTLNLRFENDMDGPNSWSHRRGMIVKMVERYSPSVLGTQEGRWSQLHYLEERLRDYGFNLPPGRIHDKTCQYPSIYFEKKDLQMLEGGEFWLSRTPRVHRSKDWDSAFPRMLSYARLGMRNGPWFWAAVTHLDHVGATARIEQARIISDWIRSIKGPIVLMGDFNDSPGSTVHEILAGPETALTDTWEILGRREDRNSYTHHGFLGVPRKTRMDWILISDHFEVRDGKILRDHVEGNYPSDHFPYMVDLFLGESG